VSWDGETLQNLRTQLTRFPRMFNKAGFDNVGCGSTAQSETWRAPGSAPETWSAGPSAARPAPWWRCSGCWWRCSCWRLSPLPWTCSDTTGTSTARATGHHPCQRRAMDTQPCTLFAVVSFFPRLGPRAAGLFRLTRQTHVWLLSGPRARPAAQGGGHGHWP